MDFAKKKKKPEKKQSEVTALIIKLGIIVLVLVGIFIFLITKTTPGRTNIVVLSKNPLLISLDNNQKDATVISIPESTMLNGSYGKGLVLAGSLYKLDSLSNKRGKIIDTTIREFLGIPVDGWILANNQITVDDKDQFLNLLNTEFNFIPNIFPTQKTSLSFIKKPRFYYNLSKVRPDRITFINLGQSNALSMVTLPDGSTNLEPDLVKVDSFLNQDFEELTILKEGLSIAVLNGSEVPGLATRASRIISNDGGKVIQVAESSLKVVDCVIYVSQKYEKYYTVQRIKETFHCDVSFEQIEESRADIAVVIGNDYHLQIIGSIN